MCCPTEVFFLGHRYDQTLFEDEQKNRMMETKELFDWVLKQPCFEVCDPFFIFIFIVLKRLAAKRLLFSYAENINHAIPQQVWHIWEEGSWCKSWRIFSFVQARLLVSFNKCFFFFSFDVYRFRWMFASGSEITNQFLVGNKRSSMHTSKLCFHISQVIYSCNLWPCDFRHNERFVKKKFEELYYQNTAPDRVDRVFKIYRTTALDQKLVKKTFKLVDETLRRRNLLEAGLLWFTYLSLLYSSKLPILCFSKKKTCIFKKLNDPNCSVWTLEKYMLFKVRCLRLHVFLFSLFLTFVIQSSMHRFSPYIFVYRNTN